jgi:hypothetical protein
MHPPQGDVKSFQFLVCKSSIQKPKEEKEKKEKKKERERQGWWDEHAWR